MLEAYDPHTRYRKRSRTRFLGRTFTLVLIGGAVYAGFLWGQTYAHGRIQSLQVEKADMRAEISVLQDQVTDLLAQAQTANLRYEQLQAAYEQEMPSEGPLWRLVLILREQIDAGIAPGRMETLLRTMDPPKNCVEPAIRRFVASTPTYDGPDSLVNFAGDRLVLRGKGYSAQSADGTPEAWYDPKRPVDIEISRRIEEGEEVVARKSGMLPFSHTLVFEGREYRFSFSDGSKASIQVSFDSCSYP